MIADIVIIVAMEKIIIVLHGRRVVSVTIMNIINDLVVLE